MTTATLDITSWACSGKYAENPTMMHSVFRQLLGHDDRPNGLKDIFSGIDVEKQNAYAVLNWGSLQDHLDFLADQERQAPFAAQFADARKSVTDNVTMKHVVLPTLAALRCLHAPLTEFVRVHAKPGASLDAVQTVLDKYVAHANNESTLPVAAAYGRGIGDSIEESILVIGWNSLEDHKLAAEWDEAKAITEEMAGVGGFELCFTILQHVAA